MAVEVFEHAPWIGASYEAGIGGKRVLVVGYSHWSEEADRTDFTQDQVQQWAAGEEPMPFGPRLRTFFGDADAFTFWNSIAFFNALPSLVGGADERYADGTPEQIAAIGPLVLRLIAELEPDRIFVFSKKAWKRWPAYTGTLTEHTLLVDEVGAFDAGSYRHGRGEAIAFGFNHPQYSPVAPTRRAVTAALQASPEDLVVVR